MARERSVLSSPLAPLHRVAPRRCDRPTEQHCAAEPGCFRHRSTSFPSLSVRKVFAIVGMYPVARFARFWHAGHLPVRFSTTTGCLSRSASRFDKMRTAVSPPLPAADVTTMLIGRCGNGALPALAADWACATSKLTMHAAVIPSNGVHHDRRRSHTTIASPPGLRAAGDYGGVRRLQCKTAYGDEFGTRRSLTFSLETSQPLKPITGQPHSRQK